MNLVTRYGSKHLEFAKSKNAIELASEADLLRKLLEAVEAVEAVEVD